MRYLPHTDDEIRAMLERIGVGSVDDLFAPIPEELRAKPLQLEPEHTLAEECSGEPAGKRIGFTSPVALSPWAGWVVRPA